MKDDMLSGQRMSLRLVEAANDDIRHSVAVYKDTIKSIVNFSTLLFSLMAVTNAIHLTVDIPFLVASTFVYLVILITSFFLVQPITLYEPITTTWEKISVYLFDYGEKDVLEKTISSYINANELNVKDTLRIERWSLFIQVMFIILILIVAASFLVKIF